ncbi:MAG: SMI1/KNR4 family protein [Bacteroidota bacterium]|nr:SMI1/KNR4 family protein [Bacteroidota bacterium]
MKNDFIEWVKNNLKNLRIEEDAPASEKEVADLGNEFSFEFPADYNELLLHSDGMTFYGSNGVFSFYTVEDVSLLHDDPVYSKQLENGVFIIANDNGNNLYVFDRYNNWENGKMAIYRMDSGNLKRYSTQYLGKDLREVLTMINEGISFGSLPTLE